MTKEKFDLKYRGEKVAVHCDTLEKAKAFLSLAKSVGYDGVGKISEDKTYWEIHESNTCYVIYSDLELAMDNKWFLDKDYTIIPFELDEPNGYAIEDTPSPMKNAVKFKLFDRVVVKNDLIVGQKYGNHKFSKEMEKYLGLTFKIGFISKKNDCYNLIGIGYNWTDEMLEPAQDEAFNVGDVVYNKDGNKLTITNILYKTNDFGYYEASELYRQKPLKEITEKELADMGYVLKK